VARVYRWVAEPKGLREAVRELASALASSNASLEGACGLLAAPERFVLVRAGATGDLSLSDGGAAPLDHVFEARVFQPEAELRWLRTPDGGRAAVIAEPMLELLGTWRPLAPLDADRLQRRYLLWGEAVEDRRAISPGWSRLASARIGRLEVPVAGALRGRVALESVEYLVERDHGNDVVDEERLVRLVVMEAAAEGGGFV